MNSNVRQIEQKAINPYFDQNGFTSKLLVINLGSSFVYILIYLGILILHLIAKLNMNVFPR